MNFDRQMELPFKKSRDQRERKSPTISGLERSSLRSKRVRTLSSFHHQPGHTIRPHLIWQIHWITFALVVAIFVDYLAVVYPATTIPLFSINFAGIAGVYHLPFLHITSIAMVLKVAHSLLDEKFILLPHHLVQLTGLFSRKQDRREIKYASIRALNVEQNWWERLTDTGEVQIGMTLKDLGYIKLRGVRHPHRVKDLLENLAERGLS